MILSDKFTKEEIEVLQDTKNKFYWSDEMLDNYIALIDKLSDCNYKFTLVNDWIKTYGFIQMDAKWASSFGTGLHPFTLGTLAKMKGYEQLEFYQRLFNRRVDSVDKLLAVVLHKDPENIPYTLYNSQLQLVPEYNPTRIITMDSLKKSLNKTIQKEKTK